MEAANDVVEAVGAADVVVELLVPSLYEVIKSRSGTCAPEAHQRV